MMMSLMHCVAIVFEINVMFLVSLKVNVEATTDKPKVLTQVPEKMHDFV